MFTPSTSNNFDAESTIREFAEESGTYPRPDLHGDELAIDFYKKQLKSNGAEITTPFCSGREGIQEGAKP